MKRRSFARACSTLCVALVLCFLAAEVDAQRRGGGGRGGGGRGGGGRGHSIQRSGPAMGGSMRPRQAGGGGAMRSRPSTRDMGTTRPGTGAATRPATQPSTRPATPSSRPGEPARPGAGGAGTQRPGTQPGTRPGEPARPGAGGSGTERPGQGDRPDREGAREDWQSWADERQDDRQKYANNAQEDRQDFYEENGGAYYYGGGWGYGYGHYTVVDYDEHSDWGAAVAGFVVGTALTATAFSAMQSNTQCTLSEVTVNGVRYYRCGSTWYSRVMDGANVNYVVVSPPAGY